MLASFKVLLPISAAVISMSSAIAATFPVENVVIEDVTVIQAPLGGHAAGNMEIRIRGGFVLAGSSACSDRIYVTTLKSTDADKRMFALLTAAQTTKQRVSLYITDDPAYNAYAGGSRCSLIGVTLTPVAV